MSTICLNMIVKNEAHVILETLENICNYVKLDYWVISDTGSTDNTREIIIDFFKSKNIKGELYDCEWRDFAYNRTHALERAFNKTDYILFFDADDKFHGNFKLPERLTYDAYQLKFGPGITYTRHALVSNRIKWKYIGVLHELLVLDEPNKTITNPIFEGDYFIESGKTGARSLVEDKYLKDANVLVDAYNNESNFHLKARYAFYCGQSYRDHGDHEKTIEWYKKRVEIRLNENDQEAYYSALMIARAYHALNEIEKYVYYLNLSIDIDPERYEGIMMLLIYYRERNNFILAYKYYKMLFQLEKVNVLTKLFATYDYYGYMKSYEGSVLSFFNNDYETTIKECFRLFEVKENIPLFEKEQILNNIHLFYDKINIDYDRFKFLQDFLDYVKHFCTNFIKQQKTLTVKHIVDSMNGILKMSSIVCNYPKSIIKQLTNKKDNINVFLSITTCKRYDLFEKTINSFLTCCKDINKIDYFFCVDDNSSVMDRGNMKSRYPFFQYYMKTKNDKGHKNSMNIIFEKMRELKPKYWIHLEDDFMFVREREYVSESIQFLENHKNENIKQIIFNKHYAENVTGYILHGGESIENDKYIIHSYDPHSGNRDRTYWPHYSLNPSMVTTDAIFNLGNFDTTEIMFEKVYADKFTKAGYKTAFYNDISVIHIGKPAGVPNSDTLKNAYALNDEQQYFK